MNKIIITLSIFIFFVQESKSQDDLKLLSSKLVYEDEYAEIFSSEISHGCCMGLPVKNLRASSTLPTANDISYSVENIKNHDASNAWVEGSLGDGIGQSISFDYDYDIKYKEVVDDGTYYTDTWIFVNGYIKNKKAWKENNRIKKLKVYINGIAFCFINLLDKPHPQSVKLGFLDYLDKNKGTVHIKLENRSSL